MDASHLRALNTSYPRRRSLLQVLSRDACLGSVITGDYRTAIFPSYCILAKAPLSVEGLPHGILQYFKCCLRLW